MGFLWKNKAISEFLRCIFRRYTDSRLLRILLRQVIYVCAQTFLICLWNYFDSCCSFPPLFYNMFASHAKQVLFRSAVSWLRLMLLLFAIFEEGDFKLYMYIWRYERYVIEQHNNFRLNVFAELGGKQGCKTWGAQVWWLNSTLCSLWGVGNCRSET